MAIIIHGSATSTCSQRVLTTCLELGIPYTLRVVNFATKEHKSDVFLKLQPWGKVPVLEDDGVFIFESRAICKYLVAKHATEKKSFLMPNTKDLIDYALFEQGCSIELSYFNSPVESLAYEKFFKAYVDSLPRTVLLRIHGRPYSNTLWQGAGETDTALLAEYVSQLDAALTVYDGILAKQKYIGGDKFTLADIYHLPYGKMVIDAGFGAVFEGKPNVWDWWQRCTERESWKKVIAGQV